MYILFEGIDTCGKSTQLALLAKNYPQIETTFEPGATTLGKEIRELLLHQSGQICPKSQLLLFLADRAQHHHEVIAPSTAPLLISDRGLLSGLGYALAEGEFELEELIALNRFALSQQLPQKIVLFITNKATLQERLGSKELDSIEKRGIDYLLKVQAKMQEAAKALKIPTLIVDATAPIETIYQTIISELKL